MKTTDEQDAIDQGVWPSATDCPCPNQSETVCPCKVIKTIPIKDKEVNAIKRSLKPKSLH